MGSTKKYFKIHYSKNRWCWKGFFALCKNGKCLNTFQHQRIREMPISGGMSVVAKSIFDKNLQKLEKNSKNKMDWINYA